MSYPYEIDVLFNSEMAATASSFVFKSSGSSPDPGPGPSPLPTEPVKLVSGTFNVTKDGGTTVEQAHTVAEITPENWLLFKDNYGSLKELSLYMTSGSPWQGYFDLQNSDASTMYQIYLADDHSSYEDPCTLCSVDAEIKDISSGDSGDGNTGITVTIKTYIGEEEITDPTYEPYFGSSYYIESEAQIDDDFPVVDNWLWQTGIFTTGESEDRVYYKICIRSIESSEETSVNNISEWSVTGQFGGDLTGTLTISSGVYSGSVETKYSFASYHRITLSKSGFEVGEIFIKLFNEDGSEYPYPTQSPMGGLNLTATKI